jgi:hypothetical protein
MSLFIELQRDSIFARMFSSFPTTGYANTQQVGLFLFFCLRLNSQPVPRRTEKANVPNPEEASGTGWLLLLLLLLPL